MPKKASKGHPKPQHANRSESSKNTQDVPLQEDDSQPSISHEPSKYRKRALVDNTAKYETEPRYDEMEENPLTSDFKFLRETSTYTSNYFRFATEREWEREETPSDDLFKLNLESLNAGLTCLPLYDILDIDKSALPESVRNKWDEKAKLAKKKYEESCKAAAFAIPESQVLSTLADGLESELEDGVKLSNDTKEKVLTNSVTDVDADLEDWLDSVLS